MLSFWLIGLWTQDKLLQSVCGHLSNGEREGNTLPPPTYHVPYHPTPTPPLCFTNEPGANGPIFKKQSEDFILILNLPQGQVLLAEQTQDLW